MDTPKILLISSASPLKGPGRVALDYYKAFKQEGCEIDFLTLYPVEGCPEIKYIYSRPSGIRNRLYYYLYSFTGRRNVKPGYYFFYTREQLPPVPVRRVLKSVKRDYDLVLILFWQEMLSFSTVKGLYKKLHCQIHFMGVDYSQMSGGCHFTGDCQRYQEGCGYCPAISSNRLKDFSYYNVKYRERIYKTVRPVVYGNSYMRNDFYSKSYLLRDARVEQSYDIYDMNEFQPIDKQLLRKKYNIPDTKKFIIFFGSQSVSEVRKGMSYLLESLQIFWEGLSEIERNCVQVIVAGKNFDLVSDRVLFDAKDFGYVDMSQMPELYSLADVYLSPSINDAGPTMVNQSLCCGTPVVAFEMGTALESIKNKPTGYCAKLRDSKDFARGIEKIFRLTEEDRLNMRAKCREYAENTFSYSSRVNNILHIYEKYNNSL